MDATEETARAFGALTQGPDDAVDLARCALIVGRIIEPDLDPQPFLAELDQMGAAMAARLPSPAGGAGALVEAVAGLFREEGWSGDEEDYYNPANSYLHQVLQRRRGIPITLSLLYLEVARRAGLTVQGVGAPGHFLVKFRDGDRDRFLDPYHGGVEVSGEALRARLRPWADASGRSLEPLLVGVTKRQMLARILANLKGAYLRQRDYPGALAATEHLLAMSPWALEEMRDRGFLHSKLRHYDSALADLEAYREHAAGARDGARVDALIERVRLAGAGPSGAGGES